MKKRGSANMLIIIIVLVILLVGIAWLMSNSGSAPTTTPPTAHTSPAATTEITAEPFYLTTVTPQNGSSYLADANGKTLYTKQNDTGGVSTCTGTCLSVWPAYVAQSALVGAPAVYQNLSTITRTDTSYQYAWKNMPLYYYSGDQKSGDTMGDGVGKIWHVAKP